METSIVDCFPFTVRLSKDIITESTSLDQHLSFLFGPAATLDYLGFAPV